MGTSYHNAISYIDVVIQISLTANCTYGGASCDCRYRLWQHMPQGCNGGPPRGCDSQRRNAVRHTAWRRGSGAVQTAAPPLSHWLLALWNEVPHQSHLEIHHADVYIRIFEYADARTNNIYRRFFPGSFQMTAATRSTSVNGESKSSGRPCMATALRWDRQVRCRASFVTWCS